MDTFRIFITILRPVNLMMIALTQIFVRLFIILPVFELYQIQSTLNHFQFSLMILATLLIAASGYIINDYFDVTIDKLNKPFKISIHNRFSRSFMINLHLSLNLIAVVLAFAVSQLAGNYKLSFIYIVAAGLLWFYSSTYKKMFLIGNLVVSLLTALVVLLPVLFELPVLTVAQYGGMPSAVNHQAGRIILTTSLGYSLFAFLTNLVREIVKDIEDIKGDMSEGAHTIPAVLGYTNAKYVVLIAWTALIVFTAWVCYLYYQSQRTGPAWYFIATVIVPSVIGIYMLFSQHQPENMRRISMLLKIIMFFGIFSMVVFYYMNQ